MIKKLRSNLTIKIFLITILLTISCCSITYFCIIHFAPNIYLYKLSDVEPLVYELSQELSMTYQNNAISYFDTTQNILLETYKNEFILHLFQDSGEELCLPYLDSMTGNCIEDFVYTDITSQYTFSFINESDCYTLFISRNLQKESLTFMALQKVFPFICIVIFIFSTITASFYSWYLTKPIISISEISKSMSKMDFSILCPINRTDEIGILSNSLNELSNELTTALSELNKANLKLQAEINKERHLKQQQLDFFSAASHDLKTPLTIIKGQLQGMLYQVGRYKDRETYLAQSLKEISNLEKMVQELLTISRIDTPEYICNMTRFNLTLLLSECINAFDDLLVQKNLTLEKNLAPEIYLYANKSLIKMAVDNILLNAIMYSPVENEIFVNFLQTDDNILLIIENTGIHIPEESISKLFNAFFRIEHSRNKQTGGTGLGLYIVKTILELHNANIFVENSSNGVVVTLQFSSVLK